MSGPEETGEDFPGLWLRQQLVFWEHWHGTSLSEDAYAAAEEFWSQACQRWWDHMTDHLPAPLGVQVRGALHQTQVYMGLSRDVARSSKAGAAAPDLSSLTAERLFRASLETWSRMSGEPATPILDASEQRYLAAYAALVQRLSSIIVAGIERARGRLEAFSRPHPAQFYDIVCEEVESEYRQQAGSDDFARLMGEVVNARVATLAAADPPHGAVP